MRTTVSVGAAARSEARRGARAAAARPPIGGPAVGGGHAPRRARSRGPRQCPLDSRARRASRFPAPRSARVPNNSNRRECSMTLVS